MELIVAAHNILGQLEDVLTQIKQHDYARPSSILNKATIGQHVRHTLEFFVCLNDGLNRGIVNYDNRDHDKLIERDKQQALTLIDLIKTQIAQITDNPNLQLEGSYQVEGNSYFIIPTTYHRELAYNIEHAIHHMALIKIGFQDNAPYVQLPAGFGVATSTIRHQSSQVQG